MVKTYPGEEKRLEVPESGWGTIWYSDGHQAQIHAAKIVEDVNGKEMIDFYIMPHDSLVRKFKISRETLDRGLSTWRAYPKDFVIPLNVYDPGRRAIFFSLLNWEGKKTESTDWFLGKSQVEEIKRLKEIIIRLKSELAIVKTENTILKEDIDEYIAKNMDRLMKPMIPFVRGLILSESHKERL